MNDLEDSLQRAAIQQNWTIDDRFNRIGSPFRWVDGDLHGRMRLEGIYGVRQVLSMYYESYPTPASIRTPDLDAVEADIGRVLAGLGQHYFPFLKDDPKIATNVACTARVRAQDYAAVRTFCPDLPKRPRHLDIGPGLGSHAIYSLNALNGVYIGLEADFRIYEVQRRVFWYLAQAAGGYYDPVVAETLGAEPAAMAAALASDTPRLKHLPSWHAPLLADASVDLVTATWVLNEIDSAGICWLLAQSARVLKTGGYIYIRDSGQRKPNRHAIDYDAALLELGFKASGRIAVRNREDFHGVPRAFRKERNVAVTFESLFDRFFGRHAVTVHGGSFTYSSATKAEAR